MTNIIEDMKIPIKLNRENNQMQKSNRRIFIKKGLFGGVLGFFSSSAYSIDPTPRETEGPFYPAIAKKDRDLDLTKIEGQEGIAKGEIVVVEGRVLDTNEKPIANATVDLWQANAAGKYQHPHDSNEAPLDPNFQGWAILQTDRDGLFRFKTIVPGPYPVSKTWTRPPHIHFKVTKKGYLEIVTQMYFPNQNLNKSDLLLNRKNKKEQALMIASKVKGQPGRLKYDIVLSIIG